MILYVRIFEMVLYCRCSFCFSLLTQGCFTVIHWEQQQKCHWKVHSFKVIPMPNIKFLRTKSEFWVIFNTVQDVRDGKNILTSNCKILTERLYADQTSASFPFLLEWARQGDRTFSKLEGGCWPFTLWHKKINK